MNKFKKMIVMIMAGALLIGTVGCGAKTEAPKEDSKAVQETSVEETTNADIKEENTENKIEIAEEKTEYTFENNEYLVGAKWLADHIQDEDIVVIDARGDKAYGGSHIENSISVTWQSLSQMSIGAPGDKDWGTVGSDKADLATKIGALGINNEKKVVIYAGAQNGWGDDGRIMWTLEKAGIKNARMLDGGFDYWLAQSKISEDYKISKESKAPVAVEFKIESIDENANITIEELQKNYDEYVILDTREENEYAGAQKYGEARGGHLPGAKLVQFSGLFQENGLLREQKDLENYFENELKLSKEDKIVTYCTAGIRSAHMQLVLEMLGYENAKNYDGSYYEWAGNDSTEVEK